MRSMLAKIFNAPKRPEPKFELGQYVCLAPPMQFDCHRNVGCISDREFTRGSWLYYIWLPGDEASDEPQCVWERTLVPYVPDEKMESAGRMLE